MEATKDIVKVWKSLRERRGILSLPDSKPGRPLSEDVKSKVLKFYVDDETSINMPGMKDFVSVRNNEGVREHIQKRLILSNLKELYELFKLEYPDCKVGFSMFASLRPKYCVLAGSGDTHTVCVCSIHQNVKLMILEFIFRVLFWQV
ncbi:uncharacterized protein LOC123268763 isoform X3 [Cotesia glomerata]|uniref:uncharacterized protein LOC123268763 isoform X3 n=1 Tax=Cotesia glomerata TaxID=32391 RepID=UPI001D01D2A9|nr:uncharacterized protein LOC123268763 isoform X3 [Cotesia glomerata]